MQPNVTSVIIMVDKITSMLIIIYADFMVNKPYTLQLLSSTSVPFPAIKVNNKNTQIKMRSMSSEQYIL